jgi:FAD dependent monooxygenase
MSNKLRGAKDGNLTKLSCRVSTFKEDNDKVTVTTADGTVITADLLVGADGVRSSVRKFIDSLQVGSQIDSDDCE